MHNIFRVLAVIVGVVIAIYLMITLFFVFLILAAIGALFFLYAKYFGKGKFKTNNNSQGVTIEYAEYQSDLDESTDKIKTTEQTGPNTQLPSGADKRESE